MVADAERRFEPGGWAAIRPIYRVAAQLHQLLVQILVQILVRVHDCDPLFGLVCSISQSSKASRFRAYSDSGFHIS